MLRWRGAEKELSGGEPITTNNRMELTAAIEGLSALKRPSQVRLYTDSMYLRDGITRWIANWKRNGWRTADKKPVKNADLWLRLEAAAGTHDIQWQWVRGHAGHPENERADALASAAARTAAGSAQCAAAWLAVAALGEPAKRRRRGTRRTVPPASARSLS